MIGNDFYPGGPLRGNAPWLLFASGFWLRLAVIAAGCVVFGLSKLHGAKPDFLEGLTLIVGCAWVAAHSFRRAKALLDRLDEADIGPEFGTFQRGAVKAAKRTDVVWRDGAAAASPKIHG
jgi:hypothetical protein